MGADLFWVAVRCGFICNSCRFLAPLDGLDVDGAVECAQCGLRQRFDTPLWSRALELIHAVGDLAGPSPEGRAAHASIWIGSENPYAIVGDTATFEDLGQIDGGMLQVKAAPGHPICRRCMLPLQASVSAPNTVQTQCPGCREQATWQVPDAATQLYQPVVGVISDDHRTDRPKALAASDQPGVMAVRCPGCGAPLRIQGMERLQTCPFCRISCLVPMRRLMRMRNEIPEPETWWLLLRGPSPKRLSLECPVELAEKTASAALQFIKGRQGPSDIPNSPGVYEAPEPNGRNWPQVALTVAAGAVALGIGYLIAGKF